MHPGADPGITRIRPDRRKSECSRGVTLCHPTGIDLAIAAPYPHFREERMRRYDFFGM
jgi:hypothetical protein